MDEAIAGTNAKSLAQEASVMKAYSLALATKADEVNDSSQEDGFGTMTEAREKAKAADDISSYAGAEQDEPTDSIGQLMSSLGSSMSKSSLGGISLAQKPHNAMLLQLHQRNKAGGLMSLMDGIADGLSDVEIDDGTDDSPPQDSSNVQTEAKSDEASATADYMSVAQDTQDVTDQVNL